MTELETIQWAKMYMDKLAKGINPIDDTPVPENDAINNVRLSKCFAFVSDVLKGLLKWRYASACCDCFCKSGLLFA